MTADLMAVVLLLAVAAYACAGGTDYGAGFWDLLAGGAERGRRPRGLIDHAMAPVWEVNNVWLIFVFVIMWTGFPTLFQAVFSAMWLPLALAAVGLVLRGAGFAFRKVVTRLAGRRLYGAVFALASLVTPFFLGAAAGGIASGRVKLGTEASADAWSNPTSVMFGLLAVVATALLGAVFLAADARRFEAPDLVVYFRRRGLLSLAALVVLVVITLVITREDAPHVWHGLTHGAGLVLGVVAGAASLVTAWLLTRAPGGWVRASAVGAVACAVIAWGLAQRPYLLPTSMTVAEGAGAPTTLTWLAFVSLVAVVIVVPAVVFLYWLDTRGDLEELTETDLRQGGGPQEGGRAGTA
ncbi:cytochrome d ubiquinol oxidase subunit II [Streptomyces sp. NPDC001743]|uniref:cytochrome d ubiquinol oxidase subunit II n=1 Tax=Streptomyces sp. NPDC001743 TaxID=3154397 RepID=UPI0033211D28